MDIRIQMDAKNTEIPDLWHLAMKLGSGTPEGKAVLATWHLAHDLKRALADAQKATASLIQWEG